MKPSPSHSGRIRVLMMLTSFQIGGTERQVVNVALGIDRTRFDLHLVSIHRYGALIREVEPLDVPHASFPLRSLYAPATPVQAFRLARYIRRHDIQIVHTYGLYPNLFAIPAARLAGAPAIISSIRDRGDILTRPQRWCQRQVCRLADRVLVNAEAIRDALLDQGYRRDRITVIRNGIVPSRYRSMPGNSTVRQELGLPPGAPLVIVLSRLNPMKGVEYFLDAAATVAREFAAVRFLIVGDAVDGWYKAQLERRAAALGIADRVVFTGFRTDVPQLLAEASVSVLPSLSEGISNTLLESMAAGVPVIATRVGGNPEVIEDGLSGLLAPPRDAAALAAAMSTIFRDPGLAASLRDAARHRIAEVFSMEASIRQVEHLYLQLTEMPKSCLAEATVL